MVKKAQLTQQTEKEPSTGAARLQRAEGRFELTAYRQDERTKRGVLRQGGCSRLLFPRRDNVQLEAVMVNISGGLAAGDRLYGQVQCHEGADVLMSAQAHERVYRARKDEAPAVMETCCLLAPRARLEWLPHGTIFFDNSRFKRHMQVDMAQSAEFLFYESRMFGRRGSAEQIHHLYLRDCLSIRREGRPLLEERVIIEGADITSFLQQSAIADGACVDATLILVAPDVEDKAVHVRALLANIGADIGEGTAFAVSCWNGMLMIRGLARSNWGVEQVMHRLLPVLRGERALPTGWRV